MRTLQRFPWTSFCRPLAGALLGLGFLAGSLTVIQAGEKAPRRPKAPSVSGPVVSEPVSPMLSSMALRDLPPVFSSLEAVRDTKTDLISPPPEGSQTEAAVNSLTAPTVSFMGMVYGSGGNSFRAADDSMDVGPNHIVQMVNGCVHGCVQIWDKAGNSLLGPSDLGTAWTSGSCSMCFTGLSRRGTA